MQIIPVLDVLNGQVVLGRGGQREQYQPLQHSVLTNCPSSPLAMAVAMRTKLAVDSIYLADLDAIDGNPPNWSIYRQLLQPIEALPSLTCWIDAGISDARQLCEFRQQQHDLAIDWIVGLESLSAPREIGRMLTEVDVNRLILSLDMLDGVPISPWSAWRNASATVVARELIDLGVRRLILLDLKRVGSEQGTGTVGLVQQIHSWDAEMELIAGGGIQQAAQLRELAEAGANGVLVATALHKGIIVRDTLKSLRFGG